MNNEHNEWIKIALYLRGIRIVYGFLKYYKTNLKFKKNFKILLRTELSKEFTLRRSKYVISNKIEHFSTAHKTKIKNKYRFTKLL